MRRERNGTNVEQDEPVDLAGLLAMTEDAADTDDEAVDPTFDLDWSIKSDACRSYSTVILGQSFSRSFLVFPAHKTA